MQQCVARQEGTVLGNGESLDSQPTPSHLWGRPRDLLQDWATFAFSLSATDGLGRFKAFESSGIGA